MTLRLPNVPAVRLYGMTERPSVTSAEPVAPISTPARQLEQELQRT